MYKFLLSSIGLLYFSCTYQICMAQFLDTNAVQEFCKEKEDPVMPYLPCLAMTHYLQAHDLSDNLTINEKEREILIKNNLELSLNYAQQALFVNPNYSLNHQYHIKTKLALNMPKEALQAIIIYLDMSIDNKHRWINGENAVQIFSDNEILSCLAIDLRCFQDMYYKEHSNWVEDLHAYLLEYYPNAPFTYNLIGEYKKFHKEDENSARYYFKMAEKKMVSAVD